MLASAAMPSARQEARLILVPVFCFDVISLFSLLLPMPPVHNTLVVIFVLLVLATLFVFYFFRDPERQVPADPDLIVSAADGIVTTVEEMEEPDFHLGPMIRIAVFLSVFDVHVNRSPVAGTVASSIYRAGGFLDARHLEASARNECRAWRLETTRGAIVVRQIAGLIARRIVAWSAEGSSVARGERIGMIRFGSRTEVFVPLGSTILVKAGDRVAGAATPIARWPSRL